MNSKTEDLKKSSYRKLKEQNYKLKQDILTLLYKPDSVEAAIIRKAYDLKRDMKFTIMFGGTHSGKSMRGVQPAIPTHKENL